MNRTQQSAKPMPLVRSNTIVAATLIGVALLAGCASGPNANPKDPIEPFNRGVYQFNDAVDTAVLKPVATAYRDVTPRLIRQGIGNFFGNLQDAWSAVNSALQLNGPATSDNVGRVMINTVIGVGGLFDVASDLGIQRNTKDFGLTLGHWGVAPGPYLVLPLLGPSTLRDTAALPVDSQGDAVSNLSHVPTRNTTMAVRIVDQREGLLKATEMLDKIALDKYSFVRDAHLQRRRSAVYDGNPPEEDDYPVTSEKSQRVTP
ncbi:VacJ family lipoprotein [Rhodoferax sp. PAMC 29310]|uniref:MlaA family lipoprotein n=1 Tax=Rhodoferax sp. PAMC 29310 TaxID=2822760 RepID=UPI001F0B498C|nr:VacJ family lipoprotein [Rhodoferax sp. PAMC 29310]